jgi:hypothetical protein
MDSPHDRDPCPEESALRHLLPEIDAYLGGLKRRAVGPQWSDVA